MVRNFNKMELGIKKIIIAFLFLSFTANCYAGGLSALIKLGKSQKEMQKTLNEETKTFKVVKNGIVAEKIKKGQSQDLIREQYGEPVVIISEKNDTEKWVYKPGYASHFDNIKIYLHFDGAKRLKEIKILNEQSQPSR